MGRVRKIATCSPWGLLEQNRGTVPSSGLGIGFMEQAYATSLAYVRLLRCILRTTIPIWSSVS